MSSLLGGALSPVKVTSSAHLNFQRPVLSCSSPASQSSPCLQGLLSPTKSTKCSSPSASNSTGDRFIARRTSLNFEFAQFSLQSPTKSSESLIKQASAKQNNNNNNNNNPTQTTTSVITTSTPSQQEYKALVEDTFFPNSQSSSPTANRVLSFSSSTSVHHSPSVSSPFASTTSPSSSPLARRRGLKSSSAYLRPPLPSKPEKVLDAPEMLDDFYLTLLDWSSSNTICVALGNSLYLYSPTTASITLLSSLSAPNQHFTSVSFHPSGSLLALGTSASEVQVFDVTSCSLLSSFTTPATAGGSTAPSSHRVSSLSWFQSPVSSLLSVGNRDGSIHHYDVRSSAVLASSSNHSQEVCGLKWESPISPIATPLSVSKTLEGGTTLASGSNDNKIHLYELRTSLSTPHTILSDHSAAVKALAWCPWKKGLLATGGGTCDKKLKLWNIENNRSEKMVDLETGSQVTSIVWSRRNKEVVTSHGYSENQLCVWKVGGKKVEKVGELKGHEKRVLQMAVSEDGESVVSGSSDETLRFWRVWGGGGGVEEEERRRRKSGCGGRVGVKRGELKIKNLR